MAGQQGSNYTVLTVALKRRKRNNSKNHSVVVDYGFAVFNGLQLENGSHPEPHSVLVFIQPLSSFRNTNTPKPQMHSTYSRMCMESLNKL